MTEREWLECDDPERMLEFLRDRTSERKLRLFAAACCRRIWHLLTDRWSRKAITTAEKAADGLVDEKKLRLAWGDACRSARQLDRRNRGQTPERYVVTAAPAEADAWMAARGAASVTASYTVERVVLSQGRDHWQAAYDSERGAQCVLLRDVFGNPFHPTAFDGTWRTPQALALARAAYEDRSFEGLPLLADALEEAGCTDAELRAHLRSGGPHARGCWALDLVLGQK
jgi:hypothetical protein